MAKSIVPRLHKKGYANNLVSNLRPMGESALVGLAEWVLTAVSGSVALGNIVSNLLVTPLVGDDNTRVAISVKQTLDALDSIGLGR